MTSPTTAGESASTALERLDTTLDSFEATLGLPSACPRPVEVEATRLLCAEPAVWRSMSAVECGVAACTLRQMAYFLQKAVNREVARLKSVEALLARRLAPLLASQKGASYEERRLLAIRTDSTATDLDNQRIRLQARVERISFQSAKVGDLAQSLAGLQNSKREQGQHE